jgi:pyruvate dehydrogenase E1 component beta subunit
VEVFDPRTLQPLDEDALIASVKKTNRGCRRPRGRHANGLGGRGRGRRPGKAFDYLDAPIARVGAKFTPIPFAPAMEEWVVPHVKEVLAAIKKTVGKE